MRQIIEDGEEEFDEPTQMKILHVTRIILDVIYFLNGRTEIQSRLWDLFSVIVEIARRQGNEYLSQMDHRIFNQLVICINAYKKINLDNISENEADLAIQLMLQHQKIIDGTNCARIRDN